MRLGEFIGILFVAVLVCLTLISLVISFVIYGYTERNPKVLVAGIILLCGITSVVVYALMSDDR